MNEYETNPQRHESSSHRGAVAPARGRLPRRAAARSGDSPTPRRSSPRRARSRPPPSPARPVRRRPSPAHPRLSPQSPPSAPAAGLPAAGARRSSPAAGPRRRGSAAPSSPASPYPGQQPGQPAASRRTRAQPQPQQPRCRQPQPHALHAGQPVRRRSRPGPWTGRRTAAPSCRPGPSPSAPSSSDPARPGRGRKIFVAGAAAVLIALGAGGVGAATALAFDDDNGTPHGADRQLRGHPGGGPLLAGPDRLRGAGQRRVDHHRQSGEGSGVVLTADGYIVTNNHVVATATGEHGQGHLRRRQEGRRPRSSAPTRGPTWPWSRPTGVTDLKAGHVRRAAPTCRSATPCSRWAARSAWRAR